MERTYLAKGNDGVIANEKETFGMLFYATITSFETLPPLEIEYIQLFEELPNNWTYPEIQTKLLQKVVEIIHAK